MHCISEKKTLEVMLLQNNVSLHMSQTVTAAKIYSGFQELNQLHQNPDLDKIFVHISVFKRKWIFLQKTTFNIYILLQ
jgi:hypothetical protein